MPGPYALVMDSPLGKLGIALADQAVCRIDFLPEQARTQAATAAPARRVARELERYFRTGATDFSVALQLHGTPFQQRVWQALRAIPHGEVRTYGELAAQLGSGARAVGNACRHNPLPVMVPCHRVVSASGIGGYSGHTGGPELRRKRWLLAHEGAPPGLEKRGNAPHMLCQLQSEGDSTHDG